MPSTRTGLPAFRTALRQSIVALVLPVLVLLGLGCSSKEAIAQVHACELMTQADVKDVFAIEAEGSEENEEQEYGSMSRCVYATPDGQIRLLVQRLEDETAAAEQYATFLESFNGTEDVDDVGDAAIWIPETRQLVVHQGDAYFALTVTTPGAGESQAVEMGRLLTTKLAEES